MDAWRLVGRRARARRGLLALAAVVLGLTTAAGAGGTGYATAAADDALRSTLAATAPQDAALRVHTRLSPEPDAQRAAADEVLHRTLGDLPVAVHRSLRSVSVPATVRGRAVGDVVLGADTAAGDRVRVVEGTWAGTDDAPDGPVPGALAAHAAARLGLDVGDTFAAGDLTVAVAALWEPVDATDPRWFGDPLVTGTGTDDDAAAALVLVAPGHLTRTETMVLTRWTLVPDAAALTPVDVPDVRAALTATADALRDADGVVVQGLAVAGGVDATLARADAALTAVRGVTTALVLALVLVALVALSQVARLLADVRARETAVLRSRGTSLAQLAGAAAVEAVVVTVPSAAAGGLVAWAALGTVGSPPLAPLAWAAALTSVAGVGVLTGTAVARAAGPDAQVRSGRAAASVGTGALGLVAAGAGLAWWQLRRYGSPAFTDLEGATRVDPLAAAALPLVLLTVALGAVALLGPVAAVAARRAERRTDLVHVLVRRQLARRAPVHAVTAALVTLTVATGTFVAVQAGTWHAARVATAAAVTGADVRVAAPGATEDVVARYRSLEGVAHAVPARAATLGIGRDVGAVVALPRDGLERVLRGTSAGDLVRAGAPQDALPVVLSAAWARELSLAPGATTRVRVLGEEVDAVVVAVRGPLPTGPRATGADGVERTAVVELGALEALVTEPPVPPNEVWLATTTPDVVAERAAALPTTTSVRTATPPPDPLSVPTVAVAWLVAACALLLAVPGVASALVALAQSRRDEVAVLRALGVGARQQARARGAELARVAGGAGLVGVVGGAAAGLLLTPIFVRATASGTEPTVPVSVSLPGLVAFAAAVLGALVLVGLAHAAAVVRQAAHATVREEGR